VYCIVIRFIFKAITIWVNCIYPGCFNKNRSLYTSTWKYFFDVSWQQRSSIAMLSNPLTALIIFCTGFTRLMVVRLDSMYLLALIAVRALSNFEIWTVQILFCLLFFIVPTFYLLFRYRSYFLFILLLFCYRSEFYYSFSSPYR